MTDPTTLAARPLPADVAGLVANAERLARYDWGDWTSADIDDAVEIILAFPAQAHQIADLTARAEKLGRDLNMARYGQPDFAWSVHKQAMADLEAENARMREALSVYADGCDADDPATCQWEGQLCCKTARAAMKGGDNG